MAKKRLSRKAVKQELSSSSKSFAKFTKARVKDLREEIVSLTKNQLKKEKEFLKKESQFNMKGIIWPLISAAWGIIVLLLTIILLNVINMKLESYYVAALAAFFYNSLYLFFAISLFFGYADYLKSRFSQFYWVIGPLIGSMAVVCTLWIFSMALTLINPNPTHNTLMVLANIIYLNLDKIFIIFLVFGYFLLFSRTIIRKTLRNYK